MAHQFDTGFSVRLPMWHGLGTVLGDAPDTWDDARMAAGLMWEPRKDALYRTLDVPAGQPLPDGVIHVLAGTEGTMRQVLVQVADFRLVARDDTNAELAVVRADFPLIHHGDMGAILDTVADEAGSTFRYETAGSLQGGRKVWVLAALDEPFTVPGDNSATYPYFALTNAHDGEGACRVIPTMVRIVCRNTFQAASNDADRHGYEVVIRHAGTDATMDDKLAAARQSIRATRAAAKAWQAEATTLAGLAYNDGILRTYLEEFIPTPANASERHIADRDDKRQLCRRLLEVSPTLAELPDTAYKLVQLAGEYLDHARAHGTPESYLKRTMLAPRGQTGSVAIKARMIDLARDLCSN